MLFAEVAAVSAAVAAASSRTAKASVLASLLSVAQPDEVEPLVGFLTGELRQGRIGVGHRTIVKVLPAVAATDATVTVVELDAVLAEVAATCGPGSAGRRAEVLGATLARMTVGEAGLLTDLVGGGLRQGALVGVMADAVAKAAGIPVAVVRRAMMLGGRLDVTARLALTEGRAGLEAVGLEVGRPVLPMLASTAGSVAEAVTELGEVAVEWKLDGIRIQVHRRGDEVRVWTRNLNEITDRVPEVVDVVRALPATDLVLDGEALLEGPDGRPFAFQDTASRVAAEQHRDAVVRPHFFDLLHLDGRDLVDEPLAVRRSELARVAGRWQVEGDVTNDPEVGEEVLVAALAAGHEGVVVKGGGSRYEAGRRGKAWRKVKPVHTFDLVVLGVEWGYGRRSGWLSNIHLGARGTDGDDGGFVMVGKTFKGMTDEMLRWQTERFGELAVSEEQWAGPRTGVVWVRPEQVVEVAIDGVQRSSTYPGGIALRFARVVRYRHDKEAADADTLDSLRSLLVS